MIFTSLSKPLGSLLFLVTTYIVGNHATHYPDVIYLDVSCQQTYMVTGDVRIKLTQNEYKPLPPTTSCTISLTPDQGTSLIAQFQRYSMDPGYINNFGNCTVESLQLSSPDKIYFGPTGYCKSTRPYQIFYLGNNGHFSYITWPYHDIRPAYVDLLITEIVNKTSSCPAGYFDCEQYCISNDLTCNGYNDCGNNRDEIEGCDWPLSNAAIAGIVLACTIVFILLIVAAFRFWRYRSSRAYYVQF